MVAGLNPAHYMGTWVDPSLLLIILFTTTNLFH